MRIAQRPSVVLLLRANRLLGRAKLAQREHGHGRGTDRQKVCANRKMGFGPAERMRAERRPSRGKQTWRLV